MENLFSALSADNTTITDDACKQKMGCSQNSELSSIHKPLSGFCVTPSNSSTHLMSPPHPPVCPLYPFCFCLQNPAQNQRSWLLQPNHGLSLSIDQHDQRAVDAYKTKAARNKRKLARQKSLSKNPPPPPPPPPPPSSRTPNSKEIESKRLSFINGAGNSQVANNNDPDLYKFCTPDDKKLRVLLKKELKNSDVGGLGRIVLPKKEAEENLPVLNDKDGIQVVIRDVYSNKKWSLKFKYWLNNKSRMYVLENTGDFVKQNRLETGDSLTLYEDESKNLYFTVKKVEREETKRNTATAAISEEEASLALLIEQLKHKEQQDHSLVTLSMDISPPNNNNNIAAASSSNHNYSSSRSNNIMQDYDHHNDDCYTGLGLLPDVHWYNFSL